MTAGNGNYFVNLLNILLKNSREKLVKLQHMNLLLADFCHLNLLCGVQQPRDETVEAGRYQLSTI